MTTVILGIEINFVATGCSQPPLVIAQWGIILKLHLFLNEERVGSEFGKNKIQY